LFQPRFILAGAPLIASAFSPPASAEPIEEIRVTATRRTADIADVSASISASGRDAALENKLATDVLQDLVGVALQQTTPGQGAAIVRGLKGSSILHLVDGMRLNNAMFRSAPTPWFALVPATSIERIEVVRGTPASLYGSDAVGGVVQSVSRLPEFESDTRAAAGDIMLGLDTAEQQRSLRATLDVGDRYLSGSISAEYLETGDRRIGGGERLAPSGYSSQGVRAVLQGTPTETRSWFLDLHWLEQPETPRIDELVPGFGQAEPSSSEFFFEPNTRTFVHFQHDEITDAGTDWKVDAAWQRIDDDRRTRDFNAVERRFEENRSDLYGLTINASGHLGAIDWIAGIDLYYDEVSSSRYAEDITTGASTPLAARFPDGSTIAQSGVFTRAEWHVGERHRLNAGIRYTNVDIELPNGADITPARLSGDFGWIFDINEIWQVVANIGNGFRAPNIADIGTLGNRPGNRFNIPNADLGAETVTHLDFGVRHHGADWHAELIVYGLGYEDRIVSVGTGDVTPNGRDIVQSVNAASARLYGVEAGMDANLSERLRLRANLQYTRGSQRIDDAKEPADRVPPLSARVALVFTQSDTWTYEGWLAAADRQDRLSDRDVRDVRIDPEGTAGWAAAGISARYTAASGWQFRAGLDNLFDTRYRVHGSGLDAPGRNLFLTIRRRW
jgi:hemoglobin/transferrin/lactoferrin receptor protein